GQGGFDSPKMVEADPSPVKDAPDDAGGSKFQASNKSIQDRLSGDRLGGDRLGSADPTETATTTSLGNDDSQSVMGGGTLEDRIQSALKDAQKVDGNSAEAQDPDAPRTVQTMRVRPDGTVESPQTQIVMPPRPATSSSIGDSPQGVVVTSMGGNSRSVTAPDPSEQMEAQAQPEPQQSRPMLVQDRPSAQKPANVAMLTPQRPAVQTGRVGGVFVQIAARQQQEQALAAFAMLQRKYSEQLGNYSPSVRKVDLAEKGTWFRLWVGPLGSKNAAEQLCSDLKTAGLKSCLVRVE
ncbi:MAG: SPOR domain-containing protein, partial [Alphaproteobacteria bacterium]